MINVIRWLESRPKIACNLAVFYAGMIFLLSSVPVVPSPPGASGIMYGLHYIEYLIFGGLVLVALRSMRTRDNTLALAVAVAVLYALTDEFHQLFIPNRTASMLDWLSDTAGALSGALLADASRKT